MKSAQPRGPRAIPITSRIRTTRQGQIVFRSLEELADGLISYAITQLERHEALVRALTWADLLGLLYTPDDVGADYWYDLEELLERGADDCEGLGMLFALWLWVHFGIPAYPAMAWYRLPGERAGRVIHCVDIIPDVPQLPREVRETCWTRYPMLHPSTIPAGAVVGDLSIVGGMPVPARFAGLVGAGPDGTRLPAGVVRTAAGLVVPRRTPTHV